MKIVLEAPGRLREIRRECVVPGRREWQAVCWLGSGRVFVAADADLMRDDLWAPLGPDRRRRTDNPMVVASWLDWAAQRRGKRERLAAPVAWAISGADRAGALALALLSVAASARIGLLLRRRRKR